MNMTREIQLEIRETTTSFPGKQASCSVNGKASGKLRTVLSQGKTFTRNAIPTMRANILIHGPVRRSQLMEQHHARLQRVIKISLKRH